MISENKWIDRGLQSVCAIVIALCVATVCGAFQNPWPTVAPSPRFDGPTSSQPLALDAAGSMLAVANPDNNTVTFFDVNGDRNKKLAEVPVGREPSGVVLN